MESELLKEWTAEERREAAEIAAKEAAEVATEIATINTSVSIICRLLYEKFGIVPERLKSQLEKIKNPGMLETLSAKVMKVNTLEEFEQHLEKILQQ